MIIARVQMRDQMKFLCGIIFLLLLISALGNPDNAYNFSCFLQPNGGGICELVREVNKKTDNKVILHESFIKANFTVKLELDNIIDKRIKAYMEANNFFGKAKKKAKIKLNKKIPNSNLRFHQSQQRFFKRSVLDSVDDLSLNSYDPKKVNDEQSEIKRMREDLEIKYKELLHLAEGIRNNISFLESEKQYLDGEITVFEDNLFQEKKARIQLEKTVEEVFEIFCSYIFITKKKVKEDIPSSVREKFWIMCNKKSGFRKLIMPISYKELEDLNASCPRQNSCEKIRNSDSLIEYNCQCGYLCSTLDTCCLDSPYRGLHSDGSFQSCQAVYGVFGLAFFMVDYCPSNGMAGDEWKTLCAQGEKNNFMTYVPVTSTRTNLTYKNYYCFACHENTEDYYFWEVKVKSNKKIVTLDNGNPVIVFDSVNNNWMGQDIDELKNESVLIGINKPSEIQHLVTECRKGVISKCHDNWLDDISKSKCNAYTAIISVRKENISDSIYRNPHCAVCNFESLNRTYCYYIKPLQFPIPVEIPPFVSKSLDDDYETIFKSYFSYTNYFTLTPIKMCSENSIWNPFSNECSPLKCSEGYSLKNRACIRF